MNCTQRDGEWSHETLDTIAHHLYVCPAGSKALERHIMSRNFLRKNEWARLKYQQMKYALADKANQDRKLYAALKELHINDFIDSITDVTQYFSVLTTVFDGLHPGFVHGLSHQLDGPNFGYGPLTPVRWAA
ncbi:GrpB family protein [Hymenobacter sp. IS2118]|uniref:GrpB family protein n=1 Tax=Hymenobacter sp. IS2118 TaxID=1505605 RepID=UPI0009071C36